MAFQIFNIIHIKTSIQTEDYQKHGQQYPTIKNESLVMLRVKTEFKIIQLFFPMKVNQVCKWTKKQLFEQVESVRDGINRTVWKGKK